MAEIDNSKQGGTATANEEAAGEKTVSVTFMPEGKTFTYDIDKLPYAHHGKPGSLLDVAENFDFFLDHACGGNCACTTCHVVIKEGAELLSEMDDEEADRIETAADLQLASRLGCQAVIEKPGSIMVEIPSWNRNYVSEGHGPPKEK